MDFRKVEPMLAKKDDRALKSYDEDDWYAEIKYDGSRLIIQKRNGKARAFTRRQKERTEDFPNLMTEIEQNFPDDTVIDGEFTFLDREGVSHFKPIHTGKEKINELGLTPVFIAFDLIEYDGEDLTETELQERKRILENYRDKLENLTVAEVYDDNFEALFDQVMAEGREGLILKKANSWYYEGSRSSVWHKIKPFHSDDFTVVGYTEGEGEREPYFGSLVLTDGNHQYVGRVGGGFTHKQLDKVRDKLEDIPKKDARLIDSEVDKTWQACEPFVVEVRYQNQTKSQKIRSPSFVRVRDDKPLEDVQPIEEMK